MSAARQVLNQVKVPPPVVGAKRTWKLTAREETHEGAVVALRVRLRAADTDEYGAEVERVFVEDIVAPTGRDLRDEAAALVAARGWRERLAIELDAALGGRPRPPDAELRWESFPAFAPRG